MWQTQIGRQPHTDTSEETSSAHSSDRGPAMGSRPPLARLPAGSSGLLRLPMAAYSRRVKARDDGRHPCRETEVADAHWLLDLNLWLATVLLVRMELPLLGPPLVFSLCRGALGSARAQRPRPVRIVRGIVQLQRPTG